MVEADWVTVSAPVQTGWAIGDEVVCHGWLTKRRSNGEWWQRYIVLRSNGILGWFPQPPTDDIAGSLPVRFVYIAGATVCKQRLPPDLSNKGPLFVLEVVESDSGTDVAPDTLFGSDDEQVIDWWHHELIAASWQPKEALVHIPWSQRVSSYYVESSALSARMVSHTADSIMSMGSGTGKVFEQTLSRLGKWCDLKVAQAFALPDESAAGKLCSSVTRIVGAGASLGVQLPGVLLSAVGRYGGDNRRPCFSAVCMGQVRQALTAPSASREEFVGQFFSCEGCGSTPIQDEGCRVCCTRYCLVCFNAHTRPPEIYPSLEERTAARTAEEFAAIQRGAITHNMERDSYDRRVPDSRTCLQYHGGAFDFEILWASRNMFPERSWHLTSIRDQCLLRGLQGCLATEGDHLGFGRDVRATRPYAKLQLAAAWHIEHTLRSQMYQSALSQVENCSAIAEMPRIIMRNEVGRLSKNLCDWSLATGCSLNDGVNEKLVAHGTRPDHVVPMLHTGFNERLSDGAFGRGCYLAEDCGKCDQYCTTDVSHGDHPELHSLLYDEHSRHHPGNVHYIFICRAVLGAVVHTTDGETNFHTGGRIWAAGANKRELVAVAGSPVPHHALLVETGAAVRRYREIVIFHGERILPEFLVAYRRV